MKLLLKAGWGLILGLFFMVSTVGADSLPGKGVSVFPVQSTIEEETFQTLLVARALAAMGYEVHPIRKVEYDTAYSMIANDDATFLAVNWSPQHSNKYLAAGGDKDFYRRGHLIVGAAQGYLIDKRTADRYGISNLEQLADPAIAKLFDVDGDGFADLTGCEPSWACNAIIEHQLEAYGLSDSVSHQQTNYTSLIDQTIARYQAGESVLYYTWTPFWVSAVLLPGRDVVWLQVPFSSLPGKNTSTDTALPSGDNYGFAINSQRIVANRVFAEKNPVAAKLFEVMKLSTRDVSLQNLKMRKGERSPQDIERHVAEWIENHQQLFDGWLSMAMAARSQ